LISVLSDFMPERQIEFQPLIIPLINIVKEKVDAVRKTAAVCLAKISRDEEN
jgi:vesicle coat complex subunit